MIDNFPADNKSLTLTIVMLLLIDLELFANQVAFSYANVKYIYTSLNNSMLNILSINELD